MRNINALTSHVTIYASPGLNVKIHDKSFSSHILDIDSAPMYGEGEIFTYMLKKHQRISRGIKRNFNWHRETLQNM